MGGTLPSVPLAVGTAFVGTEEISIRSLTRGEALELRAMKDGPDADRRGEIYMIAKGTGTELAEAEAWWESSDPVAVQKLVLDIAVVSRLQGKDGKAPNSTPSGRSSKGS